MTTTYNPKDLTYLDEASVREELTRVFDVCNGCRRCVEFCPSFPTLFAMLDGHADHDAGLLTLDQQDQVIDECFQCKLCHLTCPYTPDLHEWQLDFPRLMLRSQAMRSATGQQPIRRRRTTQILSRTDLVGNVATAAPVNRLVNRLITAPSGSPVRKIVAKVTGVSSVRLLPPFARRRFSAWFKQRTKNVAAKRQRHVTIFPTCLVEYQATQIGKDLVNVYERNRIGCAGTAAGCCGAPWLHAGDLDHFTKVAARNVRILADEVRRVGDIVVPQPTCGYVLKHDYVDHIGGADAQLVAEHTYDAAEYLMKVHLDDSTGFDTEFRGAVPSRISYLAASHLLAQNIGLPGRDLLQLTGADVEVVQQRFGIAGMWGRRAENDGRLMSTAGQLAALIEAAAGDDVAADCSLVNTAILEQAGVTSSHPIQLIARAYGIPEPT